MLHRRLKPCKTFVPWLGVALSKTTVSISLQLLVGCGISFVKN